MSAAKAIFFVSCAEENTPSFLGWDLVLPAVSIGEVGQLAVDLLIHNIDPAVVKIGFVYHDAVLPMIVKDSFKEHSSTLSLALEVFACPEKNILILQQRAPFVKGRIPSFRKALLGWFQEVGLKRLIILGSCSAHVCTDKHLDGSRFRFLTSTAEDKLRSSFLADYFWKEYDIFRSNPLEASAHDERALHVPAGGIVKSLLEDCNRLSIACVAFTVFSNAGASLSDVYVIVQHLNKWLNLLPDKRDHLLYPPSWKYLHRERGTTPVF